MRLSLFDYVRIVFHGIITIAVYVIALSGASGINYSLIPVFFVAWLLFFPCDLAITYVGTKIHGMMKFLSYMAYIFIFGIVLSVIFKLTDGSLGGYFLSTSLWVIRFALALFIVPFKKIVHS